MLNNLKSIFTVKEVRNKVFWTLVLLSVYRIGVFIPLPGLNTQVLADFLEQAGRSGTAGGKFASAFNTFTGGALERTGVFMLGIMPYITASIVFQMLTAAYPPLKKIQEEGESGRNKIAKWTKIATVFICLFQGFVMINNIDSFIGSNVSVLPDGSGPWFKLQCVLIMTAGSMLLLWLGDEISQHGIGNGVSLIIMVGIIAAMPRAVQEIWGRMSGEGGQNMDQLMVIFMVFMYLAMVAFIVFVTQGQRRIPVQQQRHTRGIRQYGGQRSYLPLKVNMAGVIPVIFSSALLTFVALILGQAFKTFTTGQSDIAFFWQLTYNLSGEVQTLDSFFRGAISTIFIVFFCFFYTAMVFQPTEMSDRMKQQGTFIPGIRPGKKTSEFLEKVMNRITLAGAIFLAFVELVPSLLVGFMRLPQTTALVLGGTGLLIVVSVALDSIQKIESQLLMRNYEGFMKKGRQRGR